MAAEGHLIESGLREVWRFYTSWVMHRRAESEYQMVVKNKIKFQAGPYTGDHKCSTKEYYQTEFDSNTN